MSPLSLSILLALADGDATSAEVIRRAHEDVQGSIILPRRSLYAALERLVREGAVARRLGPRETVMYGLLPAGRRQLQAEKVWLLRVVQLLGDRI